MKNEGLWSLSLLETIKNYQTKWLKRDILAGVTVAAIAVPQAMAYSQLVGVPLVTGIYAALIAMIVFALFTSTKYVITGPDAAIAALAGATLLPLAGGSVNNQLGLVMMLAILTGLVCLGALYLKLSFVAEFLSRPILLGYMTGLALAVIASQTPKVFGLSAPAKGSFFTIITFILTHITQTHVLTLAISITMLVVITQLQKKFIRLPIGLIVLVVVTILSFLLDFKARGVSVVGSIPTGLPLPKLPHLSLFDAQNLVVPAISLAIIAYANTVTTARRFAEKTGERVDTEKELLGLGSANLFAGVFGGMPVSASGARTAVNYNAKPKTQLSQIFGAIAIGLVLLVLAPTLQFLPLAALAVIVIIAAWNLFDYKELVSIWHAWRIEAILAIITLVGVMVLGIFQGLLLAVILSLVNLIHKTAFPHDAVLEVADNGSIRDRSRPPKTERVPGVVMYRFDAPLFFGNAAYFQQRLEQLINEEKEPVQWVIWDAETVTNIDSTAGKMLTNLMRKLRHDGITFAIARMKGPIRSTINKSHTLAYAFSQTPHYSSIGKALAKFYEETDPKKHDAFVKSRLSKVK